MKKIILLIGLIMSLSANAQMTFGIKLQVDEFDDIISNKEQKTIIERTDSSFIIREKGKPGSTEYIIIGEESRGDKNNIIDLNDIGVFGYELIYGVIEKKYWDIYKDFNSLKEVVEYIQIRYISKSQFYFLYDSIYFIINTNNRFRIVYVKE